MSVSPSSGSDTTLRGQALDAASPASSHSKSHRFGGMNTRSSSATAAANQDGSGVGVAGKSSGIAGSSTTTAIRPAAASAAGISTPGSGSSTPVSSSSAAERSARSSSKKDNGRPTHRRRASSIVLVQKIEQSQEELLDQSAGFNANADWVNYKGEFEARSREDSCQTKRHQQSSHMLTIDQSHGLYTRRRLDHPYRPHTSWKGTVGRDSWRSSRSELDYCQSRLRCCE